MSEVTTARILTVDIETAPIISYVWGLRDENIGVSQVIQHSHLMSVAAKWSDSDEVLYKDQRNIQEIENDLDLTIWIRELFDLADIVVGQNSKRFDVKTINARIEFHKLKRYSDFRQQDTMVMCKKDFKLPSYSLAYMGEYFQLKNRKLDHAKYSGFSMWKECIKRNMDAWSEMEIYNKQDVRATEELWQRLLKWDDAINFQVYTDDAMNRCSCGSLDLRKNGWRYKNNGKYQRYSCFECGKPVIDKVNQMPALKKSEMLK
jgi:RNase_H superfamily